MTAIVKNPSKASLFRSDHPAALGGALVLLALLLFACYHLYTTIIADPWQRRVLTVAETEATTLAGSVNNFIRPLQQQLASLAARSLTGIALTAEQKDRISVEASITRLLKGADYSRLIIADDTSGNRRQLNFVALDLARQVLRDESVAPEAMLIDQRWHILIAAPVPGDIPGCLLASFPAERLAEQLGSHEGRVKLVQSYIGAPSRAFITLGSAETSAPTAKVKTAVSHWQVEFSPSLQNLKPSGPEKWLFYSVLAVTVLLLVWVLARLAFKRGTELAAKEQKKRKRAEEEQQELASATSFLASIPGAKAAGSSDTDAPATDNKDVFDLADADAAEPAPAAAAMTPEELPEAIFRAYDIRGIYDQQVTETLADNLGRALGSLAQERDQHSLVIAHDGRTSSPPLYRALLEGICSTGCHVIALGQAPTPLMNFAINYLDETSSGVTVTASHNPPEYNGFKISINGVPLTPDEIGQLRTRILNQDFLSGEGQHTQLDLVDNYIEHIIDDVVPADDLKVVVDAFNGVAGPIAPPLLEQLGCTVSPMHCEVDGNYPNHSPDTSVAANLQDLIQMVQHQQADIGFAFDGDADRIVAVTGSGRIVWPDELMMIFARDVLTRQPGADIVYDVKSTRRLKSLIGNYGGRPVMWKTGHSFMREKVRELDAPLGGEYSGHLFFNDRWFGFDDGIYAAVRLIEIISLREQNLDDILATLPTAFSSDEYCLAVPEDRKFALIEELAANGEFGDGKLIDIDGLRVEFAESWGLVRASNTSAALTLRFEGSTQEELDAVRELIKAQLLAVDPSLVIDF